MSKYTYEQFLSWAREIEDDPSIGLDRLRWLVSYFLAAECIETFKIKDWADVWYNPDAFTKVETEEDVQQFLDEYVNDPFRQTSVDEFLSDFEHVCYN